MEYMEVKSKGILCISIVHFAIFFLALMFASRDSYATYTLTFTESSAGVTATGLGSLNINQPGWSVGCNGSGWPCASPPLFDNNFLIIGAGGNMEEIQYNSGDVTLPGAYWSNSPSISFPASSGGGNTVGIWSNNNRIFVPSGYSSGNSLGTSTSFYSSTTIYQMGLIPGTYTYSWGSGVTADSFVIVITSPAPTITSISPTSGSTAGGDTITITGADLTGATGITVGGTPCTAVNVASANTATCTTPAGSAGTASLVVTTPGGSNAANTLFTYVAVAAVPTLSEWIQLMLALTVTWMIGWHFHRERG